MQLFETAYEQRIPVLLKGPTGAGKTRFVEYMAYKLGRPMMKMSTRTGEEAEHRMPLITVACHEDLTASDLVGRYLLDTDGTRWMDGPLTRAVKVGAICYLDEVVEARKDTTVLITRLPTTAACSQSRSSARSRSCGRLPSSFRTTGLQSALKDLKHSPRQASSPSSSITRRANSRPRSSRTNPVLGGGCAREAAFLA